MSRFYGIAGEVYQQFKKFKCMTNPNALKKQGDSIQRRCRRCTLAIFACKMAIAETSTELPNLKIEIENDLEEAMETDDNDFSIECRKRDEGPEEGELSDSKDTEVKLSNYGVNMISNEQIWDREKRYENKGGAFVTGVDIFAKEEQIKLDERAKRFGLDPSDVKPITEQQVTELYKSLGVKDEEGTEKHHRLDAIHMRGTEDMSTQDIFDYFKDYGPASIEWINDYSCNVVWLDNLSAARAMIGLSKRIRGLEEFHSKADPFLKEKGSDKENEKEEIVIVQEIEEPDGDDIIMVMESTTSIIPQHKTAQEGTEDSDVTGDNNEVHASDITVPIPPGKWRVGTSHSKAKCVLLRFSTRADKKQPQAEKMSQYYKKYGNPNYGGIKGIITQSRKRRYQRQEFNTKVFDDDQGDIRDFSETPDDGKNPWGNLAKSWSRLDKNRSSRTRPEKNHIEKSPPRRAPIIQHEADEQKSTSVLNRIGPTVQSDSEDTSLSAESDEDDWTKRSKVPRMRMYADEEQVRIERRKAQVQAHTRKEPRHFHERESTSVEHEARRSTRRENSHQIRDRREDDLRSRLRKEGNARLKGSVSVITSSVREKQPDNAVNWEQETSESGSDDNDEYADLRDSLQGRKNSHGDLRSKLNLKKNMKQHVAIQKSPLRIEIDNDEYYRLIGSDQD
ncbi:hypothetical protein L9F63_020079 [Diploptera punctata]|uniref:Nuclear cap-binding protein subunit 3 n=1 Tax=Diploptera punctata TaxID=6984 RepID=A0AAD8ED99_DIPPU|nr:hypothetical protein L9F63_020079 [Diploptera punctata]